MCIQVHDENGGKILVVHICGTLSPADLEQVIPEFTKLIKLNGKLNVLINLTCFCGLGEGAEWEDIKRDIASFDRVERIAFLGDTKWQPGVAAFCKPFSQATVRYFAIVDDVAARKWLNES